MPSVVPETRYARSGDVNIACQVVGEGPFDLVYGPGWVSNVEMMWAEPYRADFLARLASFSRLILFDKRGTGLSDRVRNDPLPTLDPARALRGREHVARLRRDLSAANDALDPRRRVRETHPHRRLPMGADGRGARAAGADDRARVAVPRSHRHGAEPRRRRAVLGGGRRLHAQQRQPWRRGRVTPDELADRHACRLARRSASRHS